MSSFDESQLLDVVRKRAAVIECLLNGIAEKRDIESELEISRQTVGRALAELETVGVVTRMQGSYEVTLYGMLAYDEYAQLMARYATLSGADSLLTPLPEDTPLPYCVLADADVQLVDPQLPYESFNRLTDLIRKSEQVTASFPVVPPQILEVLAEQIQGGSLKVELFVETSFGEKLWACYPEAMKMLLHGDECSVWQVEESLSFGLVSSQTDEIWLCTHGSGGQHTGTISNCSPAAVEWAIQLFRHQRDRATQLMVRGTNEQASRYSFNATSN